MKLWDYNIPKDWQPQNDEGWIWYLEKMITTGNLKGLNEEQLRKYFKRLNLDEGNRLLLEHYLFGRNTLADSLDTPFSRNTLDDSLNTPFSRSKD